MKYTEGAFIGRVGGALSPIFMGMMVLGMLLAGSLKDATSLVTVFSVSGVLFLVGALLPVPLFERTRNAEVSRSS